MKRKFLLFFIATIITLSFFVLKTNAATSTNSAQTTSPTPTGSTSSLQQKQQDLLQKIASEAAKSNDVEKRGIIGTVTDISSTQVTIDDINGNTRFIDVDELTKFSSPSAKTSFGISDIEKGAKIGALGLYHKSSRRMLARFVNVLSLMQFIHGTVSSVDKVNFNLNVVTTNNKQFEANVEIITKTFSFTTQGGMIKTGFSKINPGEVIIVTGFPDKKNANIIISDRMILLPEIQSPSALITPQTSNTPPTSTGSGKSLTPIVR